MLLEICNHLGGFLKMDLTLIYLFNMLVTLICHFLVQQSYFVFTIFELILGFE